MSRVPAVLSVAGSDPSGGAGIQADVKTASALGVYAGAVVAALTAQSTRGVSGVLPVPAAFVTDQLDAVLDDLDVRALKTGMLGSADVVAAVVDAVRRHRVPWVVVDPVMVAASGDRLVDEETVEAIRDLLLPVASLVTPNLPEAATLLGHARVEAGDMAEAGRALLSAGSDAVLVKGGHLRTLTSTDVLVEAEGELRLDAERIDTRNTHGTGCTLSTATATLLARGDSLVEAVTGAKGYLTRALAAGAAIDVGHGNGPVHHFHAWWPASGGLPG